MKIFQIGYNKCGTQLLHQMLMQLGYDSIFYDNGKLARTMLTNFVNGDPLLKGYEKYDAYVCMEDVCTNLYAHRLFYKLLDEQYPGSKFILNVRNVDNWVQSRIRQSGYLVAYMWATGIMMAPEVIEKWKKSWHTHTDEVHKYFGDRLNKDLLVFNSEKDDPQKIFEFLMDIKKVWDQYLEIYNKYIHRFHPFPKTHNDNNILENIDVYAVYIPQRLEHIKKTLDDFGCNYTLLEALTKEQLTTEDYQKLSTTYMVGPNVFPCFICKGLNAHFRIYRKYSKLAVHLSYISCIQHALESSANNYVVIFEDDIYFDNIDQQGLVKYIKEFEEKEYDVLYLGFCYCKDGDNLKPSPNSCIIELPKNQSISCKHAILYRKSYLKTMFKHLLPLYCASDVLFNHINLNMKAKVGIPDRALVFQDRERFKSVNHHGTELELSLFN